MTHAYRRRTRIDWRHKGFPIDRPLAARRIAARGWNALAGDLQLPVMVLRESSLDHNISTVHGWCAANGASIAPHGKTTMSPEIIARQFAHGAWAVTAATAGQARVFRRFGSPRVLIAGQVVDPAGLRWIADQLDDPRFDLLAIVDSPGAVASMDSVLAPRARRRSRLKVLLELGVRDGRTGCRTDAQVDATVEAIGRSASLQLAGIEAFEGVLGQDDVGVRGVHVLLDWMLRAAQRLDADGRFAGTGEIVLSAGGSAHPDRVVAALGRTWESTLPRRTVLRSGCYVTHDHGLYDRSAPFGRRVPTAPLRPALEVLGAVISRPEPRLALVNFGKRDVAYDIEMPVVLGACRRSGTTVEPADGIAVTGLNDQHAFVTVGDGARLEVGDVLIAGMSHPCTAFDKWRAIPVVDDDYRVTSVVTTYF
ncbi:MAG: alanine racemase [Acidobacteria bacterium]|nr:alanine racemase [Acidobacteriota bacterium]